MQSHHLLSPFVHLRQGMFYCVFFVHAMRTKLRLLKFKLYWAFSTNSVCTSRKACPLRIRQTQPERNANIDKKRDVQFLREKQPRTNSNAIRYILNIDNFSWLAADLEFFG